MVCHAPAPPVRSVEVTMFSFDAVPTHREIDGTTRVSPDRGSVAVLHSPPAGAVEMATFPSASVAMHQVDDKQVSDLKL